jgi:hypothetical protein
VIAVARLVLVVGLLPVVGCTGVPRSGLARVSTDHALSIPAGAPYRLSNEGGEVSAIFLRGRELLRVTDAGATSLGAVAARGTVVGFDAVDAEDRGELLVSTVLLDGPDVVVLLGRVRGGGMITQEIARATAERAVREGAGEIRARSAPERCRFVRILSARDRDVHVLWSDGWQPKATRIASSGSVSTEDLPVPHGALDAAIDHEGFVHVVSSCATPSCGTPPVYARLRASFAPETRSLPVGRDIEARIGAFATGRATIVRNGRGVDLIDPLMPARADGAPTHRSARGLDDDAGFRLVRVVRVDGEPFLVGVTNEGTIHAASLVDHGSGAISLLDLRTLPRELARFEAIATPDALVVLAEGPEGYLVRSVARPSRSTRAPAFDLTTIPAVQIPLVHRERFGANEVRPTAAFDAFVDAIVGPDCVHPVARVLDTHDQAIVLPNEHHLRLAWPDREGWILEERSIEPPIFDPKGTRPTWRTTGLPGTCPHRSIAYGPPGPPRRTSLDLPVDARWLAQDDDGALVLRGDRVVRVRWGSSDLAPAFALPVDAEPSTFALDAGRASFRDRRTGRTTVGARSIDADGGAFATTEAEEILWTSGGCLHIDRTCGPATDLRPLAADRRGPLLRIALAVPTGAVVVVELAPGTGEVRGAALVAGCAGAAKTGRFVRGHLLVGCAP